MKIGFIGGGRVVSWQLDRITKNPNLEFCGIYDIDLNVRRNYKDKGLIVHENLSSLAKILMLFQFVTFIPTGGF